MKKFNLSTRKQPLTVVMNLSSESESEIFIIGYDALSVNTEYFTRRIMLDGQDEIHFQCPQTPRKLTIIVWEEGKDNFTVESVNTVPMERNLQILGDDLPDIRFIEAFARRVGRLRPYRTYVHPGAKFKIQLLPVIRRDNGSPHPTPARIHTQLPIIQVSKKHFNEMSIPQRVAILTHEYAHNYVNGDQDSEFEADENMVDLYKGLGYGKLEAVYAFANVMSDTDVNYNRLMSIQEQL